MTMAHAASLVILGFEEGTQLLGRLRRKLFREEVTARHGVSFNILAPCAPDRQRPAFSQIQFRQSAAGAPKRQGWADNLLSGLAIGSIVIAVERCGRAVFLAYRMQMFAVSLTALLCCR